MIPFGAFTFGVLVRLFLYLQELLMKYTGLKYWMTVVIFLPPFLMMEAVCCLRPQVINMIRSVTTDGCIPAFVASPNFSNSDGEYMQTDFSVWRGFYLLFAVYRYDGTNSTYEGLDYHLYLMNNITPVVNICLWIFLVVPITIFTIYIYEPRWLRVFRLEQWSRFRNRWHNRRQSKLSLTGDRSAPSND